MLNLFNYVQKGDIVIDCGAYVGKIAHYFADKEAKVYALEPLPILCDELEKRFRDYSNVSVICKGAYDTQCKRKIYFHTDYFKVDDERKIKYLESSSIFPDKSNVGEKFFIADMIDLSEFINGLDSDVKLLKLNVEGAEYKILNRLIDTGVIHKIQYVVVAFHNKSVKGLYKDHLALKKKVIKESLYGNIIRWKWWNNNSKFLNKIRKEYSP